MKLSVSLSEKAGNSLGQMVRLHNSNPSAVVESALTKFLALPEAERERAVRETHASKKCLTRSGWMGTFWRVLAEEFDRTDFAENDFGRVMAPRSHDGFDMVFLDTSNSAHSDDFIVHVFANPNTKGLPYENFMYKQDDSVYQAARDVAAWVREKNHSNGEAA
jgi:hypothetical protein